jgi:putative redox protein
MPQMDVYGLGGDSFSIECRQHRIVVDQPVEAGGTDSGPTPTELFVASLPACIAFYGRRFLERHGLPDLIAVRADWEMADRPARVAKIDVVVTVRSLPADLEEKFRRVIEHCTVHNTLTAGVETSIDVQHPIRRSSLAS